MGLENLKQLAPFIKEAFQQTLLVAKFLCGIHVTNSYICTFALTQGPSMLPTFNLTGDLVLAERLLTRFEKIQQGDVVLLRSPENPRKIVIKRLKGMGGDTVRYLVDHANNGIEDTIVVPDGHVWIEGDNKFNTNDSRKFGPVPCGLLQGRVFWIVSYFLYFVLTIVAACKGWSCWLHSCGFVFMAFPKILFLGAFLLLLSFWVDLCHQSNDEEDEDDVYSPREALLGKNKTNSNADSRRRCCSFRAVKVGSRQRVVVLVTLLVFLVMLVAAVLVWIGRGRNPIDSSVVARVYVDLFAIAVLLLGVALACYGLVLFLKMSKVRSERASSEMWKVAGLAVVSVLCFTSSAAVAVFTDIPLLFNWHGQKINGVCTSLLMVLYCFIGSSVPSAFVLWVMRELPPPLVTCSQQESRTIAFVSDSSVTVQPQRWTAAAGVQNQVSRASPI